MSDDLKKITILHSNDIHGQFTGETGEDGKLRGSLAQVAGLVAQTKENNPNTLYCIAGDVFQPSQPQPNPRSAISSRWGMVSIAKTTAKKRETARGTSEGR